MPRKLRARRPPAKAHEIAAGCAPAAGGGTAVCVSCSPSSASMRPCRTRHLQAVVAARSEAPSTRTSPPWYCAHTIGLAWHLQSADQSGRPGCMSPCRQLPADTPWHRAGADVEKAPCRTMSPLPQKRVINGLNQILGPDPAVQSARVCAYVAGAPPSPRSPNQRQSGRSVAGGVPLPPLCALYACMLGFCRTLEIIARTLREVVNRVRLCGYHNPFDCAILTPFISVTSAIFMNISSS